MVAELPTAYKARFGEICWAQGGVGYGWWPCCIFDPRWAKGKPLEEAKRHLGKRYLVYFYMCTDSPFALLPENKIVAWLEGLADNHFQGRAAKNYSKERFSIFQKALLVATTEFDKSVSRRQKSLSNARKHAKAPEQTRPILSARKVLSKPAKAAQTRKSTSSSHASSSRGSLSRRMGAKNIFPRTSLSGKVKLSASVNGRGSANSQKIDSELICTVWQVVDANNISTSKQVGFVILPSKNSSTFDHVRKCISREIDALSKLKWQFFVPSLGPVNRSQERLFEPVLPFFAKRKLMGDAVTGEGTTHSPLRIHVVVLGK